MKKDKEWLKKWTYEYEDEINGWLGDKHTGDYFSTRLHGGLSAIKEIREKLNQLDEPEVLSQEWIDNNSVYASFDGVTEEYVHVDELKELLVPKQGEVDQAYKSGYETGKQHTFYKGYLEGLADKEKEPETVADVISDFWKSFERLKEVMSMEVEESEE